ncbi:unnamed protein product [Soboliphyme baturini]|uniref:Prefoldin subunit 2 n=1 Tax=Soboliphyme baturini TaxID=241478 RepID=A0A183I925_9BILA|nr:unnamed protein product [Soboliphyme baturini]
MSHNMRKHVVAMAWLNDAFGDIQKQCAVFNCLLLIFVVYIYFFRLVIETLSKLEPERKCFRLIGEILVERKVKNVLPALQKNLENSIETSRELLVTKGKEITGFREKYNICIQGEDLSRIFNSGIALESPSTSSAKELKT